MNGNICSGGSHSLSAKVTTTSKRIINLNTGLKYIRISNLSDKYVYITPSSKTSGIGAKVGTGIVLAPRVLLVGLLSLTITACFIVISMQLLNLEKLI